MIFEPICKWENDKVTVYPIRIICSNTLAWESKMNITETINNHLSISGRMLSSAKIAPKGQICIWNANIVVDGEKYWFGDINLTEDKEKLQAIANELNKSLYILKEHDARFENEYEPLIENAVKIIHPEVKGE